MSNLKINDYSPFDRQLVSLDGAASSSGNTLYVRNVDEVTKRLESAQQYWIANAARAVERLNHQPHKVLWFRSPHEVLFAVEMRYTKPPLAAAL